MTDRLTLTRAFEGAGITSEAAERIATEIYDAIHENVATKADLERTEAEVKADIAAVRSDLVALEQRLDLRFNALEQSLDARFKALDQRLDLRFEKQGDLVEVRILRAERQVVAAIVVALTVLFAALHLWPPH